MTGKELQDLRKSKKISTVELCKRTGLTRMALYYIENDRTTPRLDTLKAIAKALDVPLTKII